MPRTKAAGVLYFPHACDQDGKSMYIIEGKYGNDGYSLWFKLLERLGKQAGLFLDLGDTAEAEYLAAKAHIETSRMYDIVSTMARIGMIDSELWTTSKTIWSASLVKKVAEVYNKRRCPIPQKPTTPRVSGPDIPQTGPETTPIRLDLTKRSKEPAGAGFLVNGENISEGYWQKLINAFGEYDAMTALYYARHARSPKAWIETALKNGYSSTPPAEDEGHTREDVENWFEKVRTPTRGGYDDA